MKRILVLTAALACAASVLAQGQIQFTTTLNGANVVPPTSSTNTGQGTFTLDGTLFNGGVLVRGTTPSTGARIHGPAPVGSNAGALFDMGGPTFVAPDPTTGDPGGLFFDINRTLTPTEINDLMGGLWYVNARSDAFPNGDIRGQITVVPEPSTLALATLGTAALLLIRRRKSAAAATAVLLLSLGTLSTPACAGEVISGNMTTVGPITVVPDGEGAGQGGGPWVGPWVDLPVTGNEPANAGTIVVTVPPGWSLIANPLYHNRGITLADAVPDNTVGELFKQVPPGTLLLKFDNETGHYSQTVFRRGRWSHPRQTLVPGEGAFLFNPTRKPFTVAFTGNCAFGGSVAVPAGLSLISSPGCGSINFAPLVWPPAEGCEPEPCPPVPPYGWDSLAFAPVEGDAVFTFDNAGRRFRAHHFRNGVWDRLPVMAAGEACFVRTTQPRIIRWIGLMPL